jgi:hypothetical protein
MEDHHRFRWNSCHFIAGKALNVMTARDFLQHKRFRCALAAALAVMMDSSTFGLPENSRLGYCETVKYATRISTDGI